MKIGLRPRDPMTWIVVAFVVAVAVGWWWNLPCNDGWSNDELAPRTSMLAAVMQTYLPGKFFRYPPLHGLVLLVLQLPLLLVAGARAGGFEENAINHEAMKTGYMTIAMIIARLVASAMAVGVVVNTMRLWRRLGSSRVGLAAAAIVASNPIVVYYARSTSVDVPFWFWTTWALVELDKVAAGEPRAREALLLVAAAMLTKDQSAFLLLGAILVALVVVPAIGAPRGSRLRTVLSRPVLGAAVRAAVIYLVVSGAVLNPIGFKKKLAWMTAEGNVGWTIYERSLQGVLAQLRDIVRMAPVFGSRLVPVLALVGIVLAIRRVPRAVALRRAMPLCAALTYLVFFVIPSRWTMERHIVPLSLMLFPYAGFVFDAALERAKWVRGLAWAPVGWVLLAAIYDIACVDGTLIADARNQATAFLETLPEGTTVEVYSGNQFMAHLPQHLALSRVGHDPIEDRTGLPGVREIRGNFGDIEQRKTSYILVSETWVRQFNPLPGAALTDRGRALSQDPDGHPFFAALEAERLPYHRVLTARCRLPAPLECKRINVSTGAETWIYKRDAPSGNNGS